MSDAFIHADTRARELRSVERVECARHDIETECYMTIDPRWHRQKHGLCSRWRMPGVSSPMLRSAARLLFQAKVDT